MKKDRLTILEIDDLNVFLNDFDAIFQEKNKELQSIFNETTIDSLKTPRVNSLFAAVSMYQTSLKEMKKRFKDFKQSIDVGTLNEYNKALITEFGKKINKNLTRSRKLIDKCITFLNSNENECDLT